MKQFDDRYFVSILCSRLDFPRSKQYAFAKLHDDAQEDQEGSCRSAEHWSFNRARLLRKSCQSRELSLIYR